MIIENQQPLMARLALAVALDSVDNIAVRRSAANIKETLKLSNFVDTEQVTLFLLRNKVLAYLDSSPEIMATFENSDLPEVFNLRRRMHGYMQPVLEGVFAEFQKHNIEIMAYKGIDCAHAYPVRGKSRFYDDIDPIVHKADLDRADALLHSLDFHVGHLDRSRLNQSGTSLHMDAVPAEDIAWVRENHHETHPYFRVTEFQASNRELELLKKYTKYLRAPVVGDRAFLLPNVDLHWSIASGFEEADVWQRRAKTIRISDGTEVLALCHELNICLFLGRAYSIAHALHEPTIRQFTDALRVVASGVPIDWDYIAYITEKYGLQACMYYGLRRIAAMLPEMVDQALIERWEKYLIENRQYDLGDFFPKMLGYIPGMDDALGHEQQPK